MKKLLSSMSIFLILSVFLVPTVNAEEVETSKGGGEITVADGTPQKARGILSSGKKKVDGYEFIWNSSWNTVSASYDNNQPHSASVYADGFTNKTSTNKKNLRVLAYKSSQLQYVQKVYYNYW